MKFIEGKKYKTRGGGKAICLEVSDIGRPLFYHYKNRSAYLHGPNGEDMLGNTRRNIVAEWTEPVVEDRFVNIYEGGVSFQYRTLEEALTFRGSYFVGTI